MTETDQPQLCLIGTREHRAHDGTLVCSRHAQELATMLRDIEAETAHLDPRKAMGGQGGTRSSGLASEQSPVRLDAVVLRDDRTTRAAPSDQPADGRRAARGIGPWCLFCDHDTCTAWRAGRLRDRHDDERDAGSDQLMSTIGVLGSWARMIREDWQLAWPDHVTVATERDLLTRQLPRILTEEWVRDLHDELRDLLRLLQRTNGTQPERPLAGHCYRLDGDTECGGRLWPARPVHTSGYTTSDGVNAVQCSRDSAHRWEGVELARLALITGQQIEGAA